jgi:hypothetical protein
MADSFSRYSLNRLRICSEGLTDDILMCNTQVTSQASEWSLCVHVRVARSS